MSHSQFHCTGRVYLDLHGLIFETSICYWQDQPGSPLAQGPARTPARPFALGCFVRSLWGSPDRGPEAGRPRGAKHRREWVGLSYPPEIGFEKRRVCRKARRASGTGLSTCRGQTLDPATGSVRGQLGQTGRLGLATR